MSRRTKEHLRKRERAFSSPVDLFPFLSILLCVVGVLAFLQILMSIKGARKVGLVGDVADGFKVAYQIVCMPEGIIVAPPVERLLALERSSSDRDRERIRQIREQRAKDRATIAKLGDDVRQHAFAPDDATITELLDEMLDVRNIAMRAGFLYEEFILFGVYPGGGSAFRKIRNRLGKPEYSGIDMGVGALDPSWTFSTALDPHRGAVQ